MILRPRLLKAIRMGGRGAPGRGGETRLEEAVASGQAGGDRDAEGDHDDDPILQPLTPLPADHPVHRPCSPAPARAGL